MTGRDGTYKGKGDSIVTVPISTELHRALRIRAASEGRTIKWIVTRLIEQHLLSDAPQPSQHTPENHHDR